MKKILPAILLSLSLITHLALADPIEKARVDIIIDKDFSAKNILFVALTDNGSTEEIGLFQANGELISREYVQPIKNHNGDYFPTQIIAYVSDGKSSYRSTQTFYSNTDYDFKPGEAVGLSFPAMFHT